LKKYLLIITKNKHCPIKKCTIRKHIKTPWITKGLANSCKKKNVWITKGLANSCKKKNVLYRQFLRYRTSETEHKYKTYKNKLTSTLKVSRRKYYTDLLIKKKYDIKATWKVLNTVIGRGSSSSCYPDYFVENGRIIRDKTMIADRFIFLSMLDLIWCIKFHPLMSKLRD